MPKVMMSVGEASGDLHGASVAEELQRESQHYRGHGYAQHGVDERVYGHFTKQMVTKILDEYSE